MPDRHDAVSANLLALVRAGDALAFGELWRLHAAQARGFARGVTHSFDADDLVSEAFARVLAAIRNGNGPTTAFSAYLRVTIRSVAYSWARQPGLDTVELIESSLPTTSASLDETDRLALREAFLELPERLRTILWLTEIEGRTPAEISKILQISPGLASVSAFRARARLRKRWDLMHEETPTAVTVGTQAA